MMSDLKYKIGQWIREQTTGAGTKGIKGVVVGLSGGIDSAVCYKLAISPGFGYSRSIGLISKNVHALYMPYFTNEEELAVYVKPQLVPSSPFTVIGIRDIVDDTIFQLEFENVVLDKIDKGNIMARTRMCLLYSYARSNKLLVMGTSNKTEIMTGYFTKWGDGVADFEPIGDLYKCEVKELATELGVIDVVRNKAPSAGLWLGQTDEGEMGITYAELDEILYRIDALGKRGLWGSAYTRSRKLQEIYDDHDDHKVDKVIGMLESSRHKRCTSIPTFRCN